MRARGESTPKKFTHTTNFDLRTASLEFNLKKDNFLVYLHKVWEVSDQKKNDMKHLSFKSPYCLSLILKNAISISAKSVFTKHKNTCLVNISVNPKYLLALWIESIFKTRGFSAWQSTKLEYNTIQKSLENKWIRVVLFPFFCIQKICQNEVRAKSGAT